MNSIFQQISFESAFFRRWWYKIWKYVTFRKGTNTKALVKVVTTIIMTSASVMDMISNHKTDSHHSERGEREWISEMKSIYLKSKSLCVLQNFDCNVSLIAAMLGFLWRNRHQLQRWIVFRKCMWEGSYNNGQQFGQLWKISLDLTKYHQI